MSLYFRLMLVLLFNLLRRRPHSLLTSTSLDTRVWPSDLDLNMHMNNGRYLVLMDLGRFDLMQRTGLVNKSIRERWMPVVSDVKIRYRHTLEPFQRFELHTRLVGWDRKWFYLEQRFERKGRLMARALVRGVIVKQGRTLNCDEVISAMGVKMSSPVLPDEFNEGWVSRPGVATGTAELPVL